MANARKKASPPADPYFSSGNRSPDDVVVEGGCFPVEEREVIYRSFTGKPYPRAFPEPQRLPLIVRRETLLLGRDMGRYCNHDYYILRIILGGRGLHVYNGHPYAMVRGDVYIVPPRTVFSFHDFERVEMYACYFQRELFRREDWSALRDCSGFARLLMPSRRAATKEPRFQDQRLHLTPEQLGQAESEIGELREHLAEVEALGPVLARNRFFNLLGMLAKLHGAEARRLANNAPRKVAPSESLRLAEVIDFCERNFDQPITVPQLAALIFLSPAHFARVFLQETGVPPATYLRRRRLEQAQKLLRTTTLALPEIAWRCGFEHGNVLSRAFRAAFGKTPSAYRKDYQPGASPRKKS